MKRGKKAVVAVGVVLLMTAVIFWTWITFWLPTPEITLEDTSIHLTEVIGGMTDLAEGLGEICQLLEFVADFSLELEEQQPVEDNSRELQENLKEQQPMKHREDKKLP